MSTGSSPSISYSRGRVVRDHTPEQRTVGSMLEFARAIWNDRVQADGDDAKGLQYICAPAAIAADDDWHRQGKKVYAIGSPHRCKACSLPRYWLGFDIDGGLTPEAWADLLVWLGNWSCIVWTTASHTPEVPRARIVLELDGPVTRAQGGAASRAFRALVDAHLESLWHAPPKWDPACDRGEQPLFMPPRSTTFKLFTGAKGSVPALLSLDPGGPEEPDEEQRILRDRGNAAVTPGALQHLEALAAHVRKAPPGDRNGVLYRAAADAAKVDELDDDTILETLSAAGLDAGLGADELAKTIWSGIDHGRTQERVRLAAEDFADAPPVEEGPQPGDPYQRPAIKIEVGELPTMMARAERALVLAQRPIYARGTVLTRSTPVGGDSDEQALRIRRPEGALILARVGEIDLAMDLEAAATWWSSAKPGRPPKGDAAKALEASEEKSKPPELHRINAPARLCKALIAGGRKRHLPELQGLAMAPLLRPDGSICSAPGYDKSTGLLMALPAHWPRIPSAPGRAEAEAAARFLEREIIGSFPFVSRADVAVALGAIIAGVLRPAWVTAPMTAYSAPAPGTGKSKLTHIVSIAATGTDARMATWSKNDEENVKMLTGIILAGDPVAVLDNLSLGLSSDLLCKALTEPELQLRILGATGNHVAPCRTLLLATGNNLSIHSDLTRRVLVCSLDAQVERPELRVFKNDAVEVARERRVDIVNAALTIALAHRRAGVAAGPTWSSYPEWCRNVRDPLIWLGYPDPVSVTEQQIEQDTYKQTLAETLGAWHAVIGSIPVTANEVLERCDAFAGESELRDALQSITHGHGMPDAHRLGKWLHKHRDVMSGGYVVREAGKHSRTRRALWAVKTYS